MYIAMWMDEPFYGPFKTKAEAEKKMEKFARWCWDRDVAAGEIWGGSNFEEYWQNGGDLTIYALEDPDPKKQVKRAIERKLEEVEELRASLST